METLLALLREPWRARSASVRAPGHELERAITEAVRVGVDPIVSARLLGEPDLDPALRQRAFQLRASALVRRKALVGRLVEIHQVLAAAVRSTRAFKGPVFATLAYEDPAYRVSNDLDFFVDGEDLARALRALDALGYVPNTSVAPETVAVTGGVELRHDSPEWPLIDLHTRLAKPFRVFRAARPEGVRASVLGVATFDLPWTIAIAALHLHQDGFGLRRIVDLAAILGRSSEADVVAAARILHGFGQVGTLKIGAALARQLGPPAWDALLGPPKTVLQRAFARRQLRDHVGSGLRCTTFLQSIRLFGSGWLLLDEPIHALFLAARLTAPPADYARSRGGRLRRLGHFAWSIALGQPIA